MGLTTMSALRSITFFSFVIFVAGRDPVTTIEPSYGPDWWEWNGGVMCPDNTFAHGFGQKTDAWCSGGGECTGLNGIQMMCGRLTEDTYESVVREYEGPFGDWHQERLCAPREFLTPTGGQTMSGPHLCHVQVTASFVVLKPRVRQPFLTTRRSRELDSSAAVWIHNFLNN